MIPLNRHRKKLLFEKKSMRYFSLRLQGNSHDVQGLGSVAENLKARDWPISWATSTFMFPFE